MTFQKLIALVAMTGLAAQANAFTGGGLRRAEATIAQFETVVAAPGDVAVETKTTETTAVVETKSVEAKPVEVKQLEVKLIPVEAAALTKAEQLRKSREHEEVRTESKIVEKLEADRLAEEQKRAEELFSKKSDVESTPVAAPVAPVVAAPIAPAPVAPVITIEKLEIVQPAAVGAEAPVAIAPMVTEVAEEAPIAPARSFYVGGLLAAPSYDSSRVKSNLGLGVSVGMMMGEDYAIEASFNYSNYYVNNVWQQPLFREMDQFEVQLAFKYYVLNGILNGRLKPFVGVSGSYIYRQYTDRQLAQWNYNSNQTTQDTNSANIGAMVGTDFAINSRLSIGGQMEYSHPIMSKNEFDLSMYGINNGQTKVEEWDFTTLKLTAKFSF